MSSAADPFATYRTSLREAVDRAVDAVEYDYGKLMRQELESLSGDDDLLLPGLLCLATADALGEHVAEAMSAATSLTLLAAARRMFGDIGGARGLGESWGMPRALNAGDGFFAVAQRQLLDAGFHLAPDLQRSALAIMDAACKGLSVEMKQATEDRQALFAAGAAFGALFSGSEPSRVAALHAFGADLDTKHLDGSISAEARRSLSDAAAYISGRGGR